MVFQPPNMIYAVTQFFLDEDEGSCSFSVISGSRSFSVFTKTTVPFNLEPQLVGVCVSKNVFSSLKNGLKTVFLFTFVSTVLAYK